MNFNFSPQLYNQIAARAATFFKGQEESARHSAERTERQRQRHQDSFLKGKDNSDNRTQGSQKGGMA